MALTRRVLAAGLDALKPSGVLQIWTRGLLSASESSKQGWGSCQDRQGESEWLAFFSSQPPAEGSLRSTLGEQQIELVSEVKTWTVVSTLTGQLPAATVSEIKDLTDALVINSGRRPGFRAGYIDAEPNIWMPEPCAGLRVQVPGGGWSSSWLGGDFNDPINGRGSPGLWPTEKEEDTVVYECGRGDKRTKKGKMFKHSHGNSRPSRKNRNRMLREKWEISGALPGSPVVPSSITPRAAEEVQQT